ncbi:hypothetical protein ACF09L_19090 [Streptomyces sp. NPDC014779]|uniref:hypothetical protein n=1 Tax=Streptomyces sp. NPDC014779 TaxID=3364911 RepID=UPI0036FBBD24
MTDRITVDVKAVEAALREYLSRLDYDLHKSIERDEETGEDTYDAEAEALFGYIRDAARQASGQQPAALSVTADQAIAGAAALGTAIRAAQPSGSALGRHAAGQPAADDTAAAAEAEPLAIPRDAAEAVHTVLGDLLRPLDARRAVGQPAAECTCGSAGPAFVPAGHYRDCPHYTPAVGQQDAPQPTTDETEARAAVYSKLMWPQWNPTAEAHGTSDEQAEQLLNAYRAAILNSAADEIAGIDFHPNAKAQCLELAQGFARRLRRLAAGAES